MKKLLLFFTACLFILNSFAVTTPSNGTPKASEIFITIGKNGEKISVLDLSQISIGELQEITGQKMSWTSKLGFKVTQKKLQKSINADGSFNKKSINKFFKRAGDTGFHLGGFALGFLLGLIGVLIAYLINDDYKQNRVKWAWIGVLVVLVLSLIIALTAL